MKIPICVESVASTKRTVFSSLAAISFSVSHVRLSTKGLLWPAVRNAASRTRAPWRLKWINSSFCFRLISMSSSDWSLLVVLSSSLERCESIELMPLTSTEEYTVDCYCEENRYLCLNLLETRSMVRRCYACLFSPAYQGEDQLNVITRVLLCYMTECLTSWNIRRRLLLAGTIDIDDELNFVGVLLRLRPKSEQLFRYRRWLIRRTPASPSSTTRELNICDQTAERHSINYASWQHRRWVMDHFHVNVSDELERNQRWIERNLSDSSAFSFRAFLLSRRQEKFDDELNVNERLLRFFVDRESLWIYRQTLISLGWKVFGLNRDELIDRERRLNESFAREFFSERYRRWLERLSNREEEKK